jgi:hypothetical protein
MSAIDEEKIAFDQIDPTFNADTSDFCARELAKSQRMQQQTAKDRQKTATLLAGITPVEQEAIQSLKQAIEENATPTEE